MLVRLITSRIKPGEGGLLPVLLCQGMDNWHNFFKRLNFQILVFLRGWRKFKEIFTKWYFGGHFCLKNSHFSTNFLTKFDFVVFVGSKRFWSQIFLGYLFQLSNNHLQHFDLGECPFPREIKQYILHVTQHVYFKMSYFQMKKRL